VRYHSTVVLLLLILSGFTAQGQNLTSADEYSQRGISRFEKNDLDGAIADFSKAIEREKPGVLLLFPRHGTFS